MYLTEEHIHSLLSFIGYGDVSKAQIIFLGNEGGLGDRSVEDNIASICFTYKENVNHCVHGDWTKGYWKQDQWKPGREVRVPRSPFLRLCSRMILALEHPDQPIHSWFQQADHNVIQDVKRFLMEGGLFTDRPGIQTALLDWRPLPRKREADPLPYDNINQKSYIDAFNFFDRPNNNPYIEWRTKRLSLFQDLMKSYPVPLILGIGNIPAKKRMVDGIWGEQIYEEITLQPSGKKIAISKNIIGDNTRVILTPFFGYEHMGYSGVKDLAQYISDHIELR
ncbi:MULTISPECIES: hypothetical protein [unclassified Paenibacillus]|uniref:hypothetical protein n=1 Tax=unclassified Paenibacillus TaxID=185978 RepID=UPI001AE47E87|nr:MULTISPECIES: hypothetical protein [unclassified Paenibacillus]MBP1154001.1 hypothetical protein [Paenibacillus sp. PvP091]MBP1170614.1 hypothetical protein [Paenibacillus sp. PvR098]MBP2441642.1 hypothetical protein [Paenibacillus sp. PvP052]